MKIILFLFSVTIGMAQQERAFGIFEACIGTDSADELIEFYELFGYRLGSSGEWIKPATLVPPSHINVFHPRIG